MSKPQSITSLPRSPDDDRRDRMRRYTIAMSVRFACFIACMFVPGWWILIPAAGAIVLPYLAVVIANVSSRPAGELTAPDVPQIEAGRSQLGDDAP